MVNDYIKMNNLESMKNAMDNVDRQQGEDILQF